MGFNDIAHCTFLIKAKDGVSFEEFRTEYEKHIRKATPILLKYGATYYNVQFNPPATQVAAAATLGIDSAVAESVFQPHDAITTIKFPDLASLKNFIESPENKEFLDPDGPRFTNEGARRISIGGEWLGIEGGVSKI
ncbi:hypothetical protein F5884DRAFT_154206 [Xylogone sp. PMI_703]|nr:hypothetical protein F5884DRAFT_154206 [Xylogone sp. PMI_703]